MKYIKLYEKYNEDYYGILKFPKKVYRNGKEKGSILFNGATFYTDSEIVADQYGEYNDMKTHSKMIDFKNPLILVKSLLGENKLVKSLDNIFNNNGDELLYDFHRTIENKNKIIEYTRNNGFDGIIMDDTDSTGRNSIISYITI